MTSNYRVLTRVHNARPSSDGDGVKIHRIAGNDLFQHLDPFLLLDEIRSDDSAEYIGGFPAHPHRGFETVTYMLQGSMRHRDHLGNEGLLESGGVQWMTAGRGVIHSEMPEQKEGLLHGFQLWLNLPASKKMIPAEYKDYRHEELPLLMLSNGIQIKVIVGEVLTDQGMLRSPIDGGDTRPTYLDIRLPADEVFEHPIAANDNVMVYVFEGGTTELLERQIGFYSHGDSITIKAAENGARLLLLMARPLKEPIKQYGPFVMNTTEEIEQAIQDFNGGVLVA